MKLGILTYHYGYNEGTLLQCFATQEALKKSFPNAEVEVIDHRYPENEKIVFSDPKSDRESAIRNFFENELQLSPVSFCSNKIDQTIAYINNRYDAVFIGSDEIWRLIYTQKKFLGLKYSMQKNPWAPKFPNIYFPDPKATKCPTFAIAPSISEQYNRSIIPKAHIRRISDSLKGFQQLTYRDTRTRNFINEMCPQFEEAQLSWLPDPTFSLTPTQEEIASTKDLLSRAIKNFDAPLALITAHDPTPHLEASIKRLKERGYTTVSPRGSFNCDISLNELPLNPINWALMPHFFSITLTERFHSVLFSLKAGNRVFAIDHRAQQDGEPSKILDLLQRFKIQNSYINIKKDTVDKCVSTLETNLDTQWDKEGVLSIANSFKLRFMKFLDEAKLTLRAN